MLTVGSMLAAALVRRKEPQA